MTECPCRKCQRSDFCHKLRTAFIWGSLVGLPVLGAFWVRHVA